jgi:hypothetical protein
MIDPFFCACWGFFLIPFFIFSLFVKFGKVLGALLALTFLTSIAIFISWIAMKTS